MPKISKTTCPLNPNAKNPDKHNVKSNLQEQTTLHSLLDNIKNACSSESKKIDMLKNIINDKPLKISNNSPEPVKKPVKETS